MTKIEGARAPSGFLSRLLADQDGNVIAILAAALVPLVGVVGGSVDMTRAYMTKTSLQAACDAGALAGRRAMTNLTYTTTARDRANQMFGVNFRAADYSATAVNFVTTGNAQGVVAGVATATIPTVLMQIFGKTSFQLTSRCSADFQVPNIDTVLVLDVTGSMADCPNDSSCNSNASSKIAGLRTAVRSFYDTLEAAKASNPTTQIRYGFVPYSQTVNGLNMFVASPLADQLPRSQLVDNWQYESRVADFSTSVWSDPVPQGTPTTTNVIFRRPSASADTPISNVDCDDYSGNRTVDVGGGPNAGVYPANPSGQPLYRATASDPWSTTGPTTVNFQAKTFERVTGTFTSNGSDPATFRLCTRREIITNYTRTQKWGFTKWIYRPVTYNVANYKAGTTVNFVSDIDEGDNPTVDVQGVYDPVQLRALPDQSAFDHDSVTWPGCLEERDTVSNATFAPIPAGAIDLNYIDGGTNNATRWRPIMHKMGWLRSGSAHQQELIGNNKPSGVSQSNANCPTARMQNLREMSSAQMDTFIATLTAVGSTYHDIGMIWGLRLISPRGMFAARNVVAGNGGQISRNIIFMTDGVLAPTDSTYSSYGYERVQQRVTGGSNSPNQATRHARRFKAMCDAARSEGIAVWTIAFGTENPSNLISCADPGRAYAATNQAQLTNQFRDIAQSIADLRLTQ